MKRSPALFGRPNLHAGKLRVSRAYSDHHSIAFVRSTLDIDARPGLCTSHAAIDRS